MKHDVWVKQHLAHQWLCSSFAPWLKVALRSNWSMSNLMPDLKRTWGKVSGNPFPVIALILWSEALASLSTMKTVQWGRYWANQARNHSNGCPSVCCWWLLVSPLASVSFLWVWEDPEHTVAVHQKSVRISYNKRSFQRHVVWHWHHQGHSLRWRLSPLWDRMRQGKKLTRSRCLETQTRPSLCHCLISIIPNQHGDQSLLSLEVVSWNLEKRL